MISVSTRRFPSWHAIELEVVELEAVVAPELLAHRLDPAGTRALKRPPGPQLL